MLCKQQRDRLITWAAKEGIDWKFIVPRTPHQGGLWEAAVKSGKSLLLKATKNQVLTIEELSTVLCQVESILNSRPLCYQEPADQSVEIITPGHFLIGDNMLNAAQFDSLDVPLGKRLSHARDIVKSFWSDWSKAYLNQLQTRNKWLDRQPNLQIGDIVTVKEDNSHPLDWNIGRVVETTEDREGLVRNCKIKTSSGVVSRNVSKIVKLLSSTEDHNASAGGNKC